MCILLILHFVFCSPSLLPPYLPLFPYTTLFRSLRPPDGRLWHLPLALFPQLLDFPFDQVALQHAEVLQKKNAAPQHAEARPEDRKSTRLNSSHVAISYAVFCLKKKKNN